MIKSWALLGEADVALEHDSKRTWFQRMGKCNMRWNQDAGRICKQMASRQPPLKFFLHIGLQHWPRLRNHAGYYLARPEQRLVLSADVSHIRGTWLQVHIVSACMSSFHHIFKSSRRLHPESMAVSEDCLDVIRIFGSLGRSLLFSRLRML